MAFSREFPVNWQIRAPKLVLALKKREQRLAEGILTMRCPLRQHNLRQRIEHVYGLTQVECGAVRLHNVDIGLAEKQPLALVNDETADVLGILTEHRGRVVLNQSSREGSHGVANTDGDNDGYAIPQFAIRHNGVDAHLVGELALTCD
jgi:hypothetical protein